MPVTAMGLPQIKLKTEAEQTILLNIQQLEKELKETTSLNRKSQLKEQINLLKEQLHKLHGKDYSKLERENVLIKQKITQLEKELNNLKFKYKEKLEPSKLSRLPKVDYPADTTLDMEKLKEKLHKLLLRRYTDFINIKETKTVGELKQLVTKDDLTIQSLLSKYQTPKYSFEKSYLSTAKKIYYFLTEEIDCVKADVDINFWLTPKEILSDKIGDDEDLAVFLCSILYTLGDEKAEVVVAEMENLTTHALVITEFDNTFILLDPSQKVKFESFIGRKEKVLDNYSYNDSKIKRFLYKFNHNNYEQFAEEE